MPLPIRSGPPVFLAILPLLLGPAPSEAQGKVEPCAYDACALRLSTEGVFFPRTRVVHGAEGREVDRYRRSAVLEELFAADEVAATHYADFARHDRRATRADRLGLTLVLASVVVQISSDWERTGWSAGLALGGAGMAFVSARPRHQAREAFSQAIWWYNRSLPPSPP